MASRNFFDRFFPEGSSFSQRPEEIQVARLFLMDYSDKQLFLTVEVGIQSAPRITGILRDLLRHSAAKPVTQKVPSAYGDQCGTSLCFALLARESLS